LKSNQSEGSDNAITHIPVTSLPLTNGDRPAVPPPPPTSTAPTATLTSNTTNDYTITETDDNLSDFQFPDLSLSVSFWWERFASSGSCICDESFKPRLSYNL